MKRKQNRTLRTEMEQMLPETTHTQMEKKRQGTSEMK